MERTEKNLQRLTALASQNVIAAAEFAGLLFRGIDNECLTFKMADLWKYARKASYEPIEENKVGANTSILAKLLKQEKAILDKMNCQPAENNDNDDLEGFVIINNTNKKVTVEDLQKAFELKEQELRVSVLQWLKSWVIPYKTQERQEIDNAEKAAQEKISKQIRKDRLLAEKERRDAAKDMALTDEELDKALAECDE
jgi:hypothetical protein